MQAYQTHLSSQYMWELAQLLFFPLLLQETKAQKCAVWFVFMKNPKESKLVCEKFWISSISKLLLLFMDAALKET